jgi:hypothetical protein
MSSSTSGEWPLEKIVFSVLITAGYVCAAVSFLFMARVFTL